MYKIDKIQKEYNKMHSIGKIISIISYIILIPIIIVNFTLIIKSFISPNETPDFFGYKNFIIVSGSMEPNINIGDAIFIKEVPEEELKIKDVISFDEEGVIVTHRIIDIIEEDGIRKYKTKGDNNNTADKEMTTYDKIEGKYQFKLNKFGIFTEILKNPITLIALVLIVILISLNKNRLNKKKQVRKEKRRKYNDENN